jgi:hypothetical protein
MAAETPRIDERRLVYDLFELSFPVRLQLLLKLGLVRDDDTDLSDSEVVARALDRARNEGKLEALRNAVVEKLRGK